MSSGSFADGVLGGLGLFLLGAWLVLEGLGGAGGAWLRATLARRARDRRTAWSSGALFGLGLPLSEASGRALGGLANTALLPLRTSLWFSAGHVAGLAGTAWLFALLARTTVGDALALALVAGGVAARWSGPERTRGAVGRALAGWGLALFGLGLMADGFEHVRGLLRLDSFGGGFALRTLALGVVGAAFAALLRSAAAAVALGAAAASAGALEVTSALAVALGALGGSSWGALLALETGTASARRAALGALGVHLLAALGGAALVACALPVLADPPGMLADPAVAMALLLSLAPGVPVLALLAVDAHAVRLLESRFRPQESDPNAAQHLDPNLDALPELGLEALVAEAGRVHAVARRLAANVLAREPVTGRRQESDRAALRALAEAVEQGSAALARRPLSSRAAAALPCLARATQASWELGEQSAWLNSEGLLREGPLGETLEARVLRLQLDLIQLLDQGEPLAAGFSLESMESRLALLEGRVGEIRDAAVMRCVQEALAPQDLERSIERLSTLRRLAQLTVDSAGDLARARGEPEPRAEVELEAEGEAVEAPVVA